MRLDFFIKKIKAEETYPLRQSVLRAGLPLEACQFSGDTDSTTSHWGAFINHQDKSFECVGIVSVYQRSFKGSAVLLSGWQNRLCQPLDLGKNLDVKGGRTFYQLRGMATSSMVRGLGCGRALLERLSVELQIHSQATIWANARSEAVGFYENFGYEVASEEFMIEGVGPHFVIVKDK